MKCTNCNTEFDGKFCPQCGASIGASTTETPVNNAAASRSENGTAAAPNSDIGNNRAGTVKEIAVGGAINAINWRLKFLFIGALGAGIFMLVQGARAAEIMMIILGIVMLGLGVLLMPFMTKRYKKWQFYLLVALAIGCAALAASIWNVTDTPDTDTSQTQRAEDNTEKKVVSQTDTLEKFDEGSGSTYSVTLPGTDYRTVYNFNINSADAVRMNNEINSIFSSEAYSDDEVKEIHSDTYQYGSICSIVTELESNTNDYREVAAYTINTDTGKEITDSELLSYADTYEEVIKNQIRSELEYKYISASDPSLASNEARQEALNDKNIKKFFIFDDGGIGAILHYYSFAGGYNDIYYTGHTAVNAPVPAADSDWFLTYNSFYRVRDIGDLTIISADKSNFTAVYTDSNGTTLEWQLDAKAPETGDQGELIYHYGKDFVLTYYPGDNHVEILSSDYTFAGIYESNRY